MRGGTGGREFFERLFAIISRHSMHEVVDTQSLFAIFRFGAILE